MSGAIPLRKALADLASRPVEEQAEVLATHFSGRALVLAGRWWMLGPLCCAPYAEGEPSCAIPEGHTGAWHDNGTTSWPVDP